jgi:hypothetical protein
MRRKCRVTFQSVFMVTSYYMTLKLFARFDTGNKDGPNLGDSFFFSW